MTSGEERSPLELSWLACGAWQAGGRREGAGNGIKIVSGNSSHILMACLGVETTILARLGYLQEEISSVIAHTSESVLTSLFLVTIANQSKYLQKEFFPIVVFFEIFFLELF